MQISKILFLAGALSAPFILSVGARQIVKDTMVSDLVVRIDDLLFARHVQVSDGVKTERCQVNNQDVSVEVFEDQLVRAEAEERRRELRQEAENFGAREREEQLTRMAVTKKLLSQLVDRFKRDLSLLEKFTLERYFDFTPETVTREEYEQVVTQLLPAAVKVLSAEGSPETYGTIAQLYQDLEPYERRINGFVFTTIRQAIKQGDDPKLLKELLAVVS